MKKIVLLFIVTFDIIFSGIVFSKTLTNELSNELLRFHILANSNSKEDQAIKLDVRNYVLELLNDKKFKSKEDVILNIYELENKINNFLEEKNIEYRARLEFNKSKFPLKIYEQVTIPSGEYEALRIFLGRGKGENWWCIAYPPMCFTKSTVGNLNKEEIIILKDLLSKNTYNTIISKNNKFKFKLLGVEVINKILNSSN